jgi:hypothetical protein
MNFWRIGLKLVLRTKPSQTGGKQCQLGLKAMVAHGFSTAISNYPARAMAAVASMWWPPHQRLVPGCCVGQGWAQCEARDEGYGEYEDMVHLHQIVSPAVRQSKVE